MLRKSGLILLLLFFGVAMCASYSSAENGWRYWTQGEVTKSPWSTGQFTKIEVDDITYTFMPNAKIIREKKGRHGGTEEWISQHNVFRFQKVNMLVQGFRIYRLKVTP